MGKFEINQVDVKNDGRIILYQRPRPDGSVIPTWQMRISVPNSTGYHRASTGEKEQSEAIRKATNTYEELYMKVMTGGSFRSKSFEEVYESWKVDLPKMVTKRHPTYVKERLSLVRNYPLRFFGDQKVEEIEKSSFNEYWIWRRQNSVRTNPATGKSTPYSPSNNSLRKEAVALKLMFTYSVDKGWMKSIPNLNIPSLDRDARRATFTLNEWRLLTRRMREWTEQTQTGGTVGRDRYVTQQYVLILANCGARIGELRYLRWNELRTKVNEDGSKTLIANVFGKTSEREIVFLEGSEVWVKHLYDLRKKELGDHPPSDGYVVCHKDGKPIGSLKKGFDSLLDYCDLTNDSLGRKRTLYSLRHFYATQRLSKDVSPFLLAKQMGTSVEMLERFYGQVVTSLVRREINKNKVSRNPPKPSENEYPFEDSKLLEHQLDHRRDGHVVIDH